MDFKGLKDLKVALIQIQNDLIFLRQNMDEENTLAEIGQMLSSLRMTETCFDKFDVEGMICQESSSFTNGGSEGVWKSYRDILLNILAAANSSTIVSVQDLSKQHPSSDFDIALFQPNLQNKIYYPPQQIINGNNWSQVCGQLGSESMVLMSTANCTVNNMENNKSNNHNLYTTVNKCNLVTNDVMSMYGGGDSISLRRSKLPPQPEKDIEEIQQTITMQLKLQQHHSRHRYKFQPTHRAWPITPEINVVFQGNGTSNQLFTTNADPQIYTSNNAIGVHNQYHPQSPTPQILTHPITTSTGTFYGYSNSYTGPLTNGTILQANDCDYAQLPTSMFSFLNNSSSNRMGNCALNAMNSTTNIININTEDVEDLELDESHGSSKVGETKSHLIDYQIKPATLTWEDLASVSSTSTN